MKSTIIEILKNQISVVETNYNNLKKDVCNLINNVNEDIQENKIDKTEKEKYLEMRFDLKRIRNILNSGDKRI